MSSVQTKATTCLLPSGLLLLKCVAHACMDVRVQAHYRGEPTKQLVSKFDV